MARQQASPILLPLAGGSETVLQQLSMDGGTDAVRELAIQTLIQAHPGCLPIDEIDPTFSNPVPICMELNTPAGPIDNFMVTARGFPVLVECKLWRNPEGRRQVVSQILDYAKELSRWSSSDLQREVARRLGRDGNALLDLVRAAGHEIDEIAFNDALTLNLRRGRFLLLIVGDGIREGVEAIAEYLQAHAGLHFSLGLVELPIFALPNGDRIAMPRLLARTQLITRTVVAAPENMVVHDGEPGEFGPRDPADDVLDAATLHRLNFLHSALDGIVLDDPDQVPPKVTPRGYCYIYMPAPTNSCWIDLNVKPGSVTILVTSSTNSVGSRALQAIAEDWEATREELGGRVELRYVKGQRPRFEESYAFTDETQHDATEWLGSRLNDFVNIFRPRVRAAVQDQLSATGPS